MLWQRLFPKENTYKISNEVIKKSFNKFINVDNKFELSMTSYVIYY